MQRKWRCDKGERSQSQSITIDIQRYTKRCNKIRFQQFQVSTVATAFLCLIDTWYNNSQFEGENKVISRFITIEIQRAQKVRTQGREEKKSKRNECRSNFQQHFFSSSHLKAGVCTAREQKQRDRTVKNPSEAFNLLLQQNFISTLIFFMRDEGRRVRESEKTEMRSLYTIETNISCFCIAVLFEAFLFHHNGNAGRKTATEAEYCINALMEVSVVVGQWILVIELLTQHHCVQHAFWYFFACREMREKKYV